MKVMVNGKSEETAEKNVADYVQTTGFNPKSLVVEHNGQVIREELWPITPLSEGDQLELLSFVGGG